MNRLKGTEGSSHVGISPLTRNLEKKPSNPKTPDFMWKYQGDRKGKKKSRAFALSHNFPKMFTAK